jgi:hypothetical protein
LGLGRESEQLADEVSLADRISFGQPSHSALPVMFTVSILGALLSAVEQRRTGGGKTS